MFLDLFCDSQFEQRATDAFLLLGRVFFRKREKPGNTGRTLGGIRGNVDILRGAGTSEAQRKKDCGFPKGAILNGERLFPND